MVVGGGILCNSPSVLLPTVKVTKEAGLKDFHRLEAYQEQEQNNLIDMWNLAWDSGTEKRR